MHHPLSRALRLLFALNFPESSLTRSRPPANGHHKHCGISSLRMPTHTLRLLSAILSTEAVRLGYRPRRLSPRRTGYRTLAGKPVPARPSFRCERADNRAHATGVL